MDPDTLLNALSQANVDPNADTIIQDDEEIKNDNIQEQINEEMEEIKELTDF